MINNVITNIDIIHDDYKGEYAYRFTRAIATLINNTRLQLHAQLYCGAEGKFVAVNSFLDTFTPKIRLLVA
jgi:hypothetical protein